MAASGPVWLRALERVLGTPKAMQVGLSLYPPYIGAGIVCARVSDDLRTIEMELRDRGFNRNYVGTHFGGSLFAMCDPHHMLILLRALGSGVRVWDEAASIRFVRPGRGTVRAVFTVDDDRLADIRARLEQERVLHERFHVDVTDAEGKVVAEVDKVVYLRRVDRPPT